MLLSFGFMVWASLASFFDVQHRRENQLCAWLMLLSMLCAMYLPRVPAWGIATAIILWATYCSWHHFSALTSVLRWLKLHRFVSALVMALWIGFSAPSMTMLGGDHAGHSMHMMLSTTSSLLIGLSWSLLAVGIVMGIILTVFPASRRLPIMLKLEPTLMGTALVLMV